MRLVRQLMMVKSISRPLARLFVKCNAMIKRILKGLIPRGLRVFFKNAYTLGFEFGQVKTARQWSSIDKHEGPIPWYTYPAVEFINQLDFTDKKIFEYGSGNSTLYWEQRCRTLVSVEDDEKWYQKVSTQLHPEVRYRLFYGRDEYIRSIHEEDEMFDVVAIDGCYRYECTAEAVKRITSNAMIILDNSDWYPEAAKLLRDSDLIQVDMAGFGPINAYTWTTSLFLTRNFRFKPASERQPMYGIGGLHHNPES